MRIIGFLFVFVLTAWFALGSGKVNADTPVREAILYCDSASSRALLLFNGGWDDLPVVPPELAGGLNALEPAKASVCRLADGREVKAKVGHDQAFPYGMCGADPAYFFSLWIDGKKVIGAGDFYAGCTYGFSRRAIVLDGVRLTDCRIALPAGQEGDITTSDRVLACTDVSSLLAAAKYDPVEYPTNGAPRVVGSIVVEAGDPAYCERFIEHITDREERWDGLTTRWGPGDLFHVDRGAVRLKAAPKIEKAKRGTIYQVDFNNDGQEDRVLWSSQESHYFDGDYFVVAPRDEALTPWFESAANGSEDVESTVAAAKLGGLIVISGAETPYQTIRYTHFVPILADGTMLLWAWPTYERKLPTALLYRPEPSGTLTRICQFQRVLENF